jgi:hypothetical protein
MPHRTIEGIENINPNGYGGMCSRSAVLSRAGIDFERGIDTVATTDAPVLVVDWERWEIVREILPMRYAEIPEKVPLMDAHNTGSVDKIRGSAKDFRTTQHELLAKTFVSPEFPTIRSLISDGHLDSVSIGYVTEREFTVEVPKKTTVKIDGEEYRNDFEDDYPLVVRTKWSVRELSLVPIGADSAAKFKSAIGHNKRLFDELAKLRAEFYEFKQSFEKPKDKKRLAIRLALMNQQLKLT